jgi:hypothetical protein
MPGNLCSILQDTLSLSSIGCAKAESQVFKVKMRLSTAWRQRWELASGCLNVIGCCAYANRRRKLVITPVYANYHERLTSRFVWPDLVLCTSAYELVGGVYSDLSFIAFRLAFTSFFTNVVGTGLPIGKLTMAFVVV